MGLKQLQWLKHKDGLIARIRMPFDTNPEREKFRRFAHVNILPWHIKPKRGKCIVDLLDVYKTFEQYYWFDDLETAKAFVEATFALED